MVNGNPVRFAIFSLIQRALLPCPRCLRLTITLANQRHLSLFLQIHRREQIESEPRSDKCVRNGRLPMSALAAKANMSQTVSPYAPGCVSRCSLESTVSAGHWCSRSTRVATGFAQSIRALRAEEDKQQAFYEDWPPLRRLPQRELV